MKFTEILKISFVLSLPIWMGSCNKTEDTKLKGNWVELSYFEGIPRSDAVGFAIGDKGYVCAGYDGENRLKDLWQYDTNTHSWSQKADLPGVARNGAVGFATDTKGYVGTGYDGKDKLKDFWEYNPGSNSWTQKADFGGSARYAAVAFSINNLGYIGTGYDGYSLKDLWQYNPETDTWTAKTSFGGEKRRDAVAFVINGLAYICTGINNGAYVNDLFEYNPETDQWTKKEKITAYTNKSFDDKYTTITGSQKVAFTMNGKGYLVGGSGSVGNNVWEYDPITDRWTEKTAFEGTGRIEAVAFSIGNQGFVTTGRSSTYYFDDLWTFYPEEDYDKYD
jgi:N-acetylneuraminic acid mutarotase